MELKTLLEKELQQTQATFGIAVTHLETGEQVSINGDQLFQMASTFKVPILAALLDEVDKGTLTLDEEVTITEEDFVSGSGVIVQLHDGVKLTIKDLAMLMIIVSDNLATDCLLHRIGMDTVNKFIQQHGYGKIYVHQTCKELLSVMVGLDPTAEDINDQLRNLEYSLDIVEKDNIVFQVNEQSNASSPLAMNELLIDLVKGNILSEQSQAVMLDILKKQQFGRRIPYLLPDDVTCAHKTGTVGDVVNDVGIVYLPDDQGAFVISAFSKDNDTVADGENMIAKLTKVTYDYFLSKAKEV